MIPVLTQLLRNSFELKGSLRFQGVGGLVCGELLTTRERVAVRWMPHSPEALEALALLRSFPAHRALPGLLDSGEGQGVVWAVHAFPQGVLLGSQALPPARLLEVGAQLAGALAALHEGGLLHGELSDESVLLAGERVLLHDGPVVVSHRVVERRGEARALAVLSATAAFLSPERAKGAGPSTAADVYALGALLGLATGAKPPPGTGALERMFALTSGAWRLEVPATVDSPLRTLLSAMLAAEPGRRPDAAQVLVALEALKQVAALEAQRLAAETERGPWASKPVEAPPKPQPMASQEARPFEAPAAASPRNGLATLEVPVVPWASAPTYTRPPQTSDAHVVVDLAGAPRPRTMTPSGAALPYELPPTARPTAPQPEAASPNPAESDLLPPPLPTSPGGGAGWAEPPRAARRPTPPSTASARLASSPPANEAVTDPSRPPVARPAPEREAVGDATDTLPMHKRGAAPAPAAGVLETVRQPPPSLAPVSSDAVATLPAPSSYPAVVAASAGAGSSAGISASFGRAAVPADARDTLPAPSSYAAVVAGTAAPLDATTLPGSLESELAPAAAPARSKPPEAALAGPSGTLVAAPEAPSAAASLMPVQLRPTAPGPSPAKVAALFESPAPPAARPDVVTQPRAPAVSDLELSDPKVARTAVVTVPSADPFEQLVASKPMTANGLAPGAEPTLVDRKVDDTDNAVPVVRSALDSHPPDTTLPPDAVPPRGFSRSRVAATQQIVAGPPRALAGRRNALLDAIPGPRGLVSFFASDNLRLGLLGAVAALSVVLSLTLFAQYEERTATRETPADAAALAREAAKRLVEEPPPPQGTALERVKQKLGVDDGF